MSDNVTEPMQGEPEAQDVFQRRLGRSARSTEAVPDTDTEREVYQAFGLAQEGREEDGLTFYHEDGVITAMFYVHMTGMICTSHQFLSLVYTDCVYTLEGRNLHMLIPLLKRRKIDFLHCYSPRDFVEPANEPVVRRIRRESHMEAMRMQEEAEEEASHG